MGWAVRAPRIYDYKPMKDIIWSREEHPNPDFIVINGTKNGRTISYIASKDNVVGAIRSIVSQFTRIEKIL